MGIELTKDSVDVGIVVRDRDAALHFYRDVLGLDHVGQTPAPGGGTIERLQCGTSTIKLMSHPTVPEQSNPPGGLFAATGIRYWTIFVSNLEEMVRACEAAGRPVAMPITEIRPGVSIAIVEDPDGNWVEFLRMG
jgi:catechol 2,3-dioxygenase-like lactoylglutathione lyase family enzyme